MAIVVVATLFPVPAHRDEVIAALETTGAKVHADDGTLLYALHEGRDGRLVMIEKYADRDALRTARALSSPSSAPPWKASSPFRWMSRYSRRTRPGRRRRAHSNPACRRSRRHERNNRG